VISNADGQEYERIEYTPYGELWIEKASTASNIDIPYRFTGKERDEETWLYYYRERYLDSKTSRWLSTGPVGR
jgi:RHS repeat-associated protein